ncbi:MAG: CoA pyrophosphatase [Sphingobacteriales bacterium]|nr:CoA pyrophosphatase [Sphingobacteriales bacterium]
MPYPSLIARLAASLLQTLPGAQAHQRLSPALRFPPHLPMPDQRKARQSAVLLLLYPSIDAQWHIALMQRNPNSRHHAAQISLPGGGIEPQDADLNATALRETAEEFGIDTGSIQVLGALSPIYIPVSNAAYSPLWAIAHNAPILYPTRAK